MPEKNETRYCLNCDHHLQEKDHYCPRCGQKKMEHRLSFREFISDFFSNYLSWDSRFGRSISPFLFNPGFLTNKYLEGKRMSYVNPIRFYVLISFLFFLLLSLLVDDSIVGVNSSQYPNGDSLTTTFSINPLDSIAQNPELDQDTQELIEGILQYSEGNEDKFTRDGIKKLIQNPTNFFQYYISKLPIMMFILMPVYALVLWFFFWNRHPFYLQHLIHTLHLHAFMFFFLIIITLFVELVGSYTWLNWIFALAFLTYVFFSFKKVYRQKYLTILYKYLLIGTTYFFLLLFFSIGALLVSIYLF